MFTILQNIVIHILLLNPILILLIFIMSNEINFVIINITAIIIESNYLYDVDVVP